MIARRIRLLKPERGAAMVEGDWQALAQIRRAVQSVTLRIGPRLFWTLLLLEVALLAGVLYWALGSLPRQQPLSAGAERAVVREALLDRLSGTTFDPQVEVLPGLQVRESNLRGFELNGSLYYYYVEGRANYDPLSRGAVNDSQIEVVLYETAGPQPVVVYRLLERRDDLSR